MSKPEKKIIGAEIFSIIAGGNREAYEREKKRTRRKHDPPPSQPAASQPKEPPLDSPPSQPVLSQPNASQPNLLAAVPDSAGYTKTPNRFYDYLCAHLTPDEQAVYAQLFRLSHGYNKDTCFISNNRLSERSNVPVSTLKRVTLKLVGKGLIEKIGATHGAGKEQGVTYRIPAMSQITVGQPRVSQPAMSHNKEKDFKQTIKLCARCEALNGFYYPDPSSPSKGMKRCDHRPV